MAILGQCHDSDIPSSYTPLLVPEAAPPQPSHCRHRYAAVLTAALLALALFGTMAMYPVKNDGKMVSGGQEELRRPEKILRGVAEGVSSKSFRPLGGAQQEFSWNREVLAWQRSAFHFQPKLNWMNGKGLC